jgi:hypothetical protein
MDKFYKIFYKHYDQIVKASEAEQRSPINEKSTSEIASMQNLVSLQFEKYMGNVKNAILELNTSIEKGALLS